jgi:hypothetical protein
MVRESPFRVCVIEWLRQASRWAQTLSSMIFYLQASPPYRPESQHNLQIAMKIKKLFNICNNVIEKIETKKARLFVCLAFYQSIALIRDRAGAYIFLLS